MGAGTPIMKAPPFTAIIHAGNDEKRKIIEIGFTAVNGQAFAIELDAAIVPFFMVALADQMRRLLAKLPETDWPPTQGVQFEGVQQAMKEDGTPSLVLRLKGGAELALEFDVRGLAVSSEEVVHPG
jgi:hypothetical protein